MIYVPYITVAHEFGDQIPWDPVLFQVVGECMAKTVKNLKSWGAYNATLALVAAKPLAGTMGIAMLNSA